MKKLFSTLVAAAAALTLCLSASAEESNLIKNGDFEGSDLSQLNGFQLGMPENNPIIVDGAGRDGSKALQMGGDKNGDSWPAWINMRVGNLSLEKGKTYKFSGYVKGEENLILDVQAYHPANQQKHIMETYYGLCITSAETGLNVTTEWQPFEIVFSMASEDAALDARLVTSNEWALFAQYSMPQEGVTFPVNAIYWDDLSLVEYTETTPPEDPGEPDDGDENTGDGDANGNDGKTDSPKTGVALPTAAFALAAVSGGAILIGKKRR